MALNGLLVAMDRSALTCTSSPGASNRQPGSSSIRSLAMITDGCLARCADRVWIRLLTASSGAGPGGPAGRAVQQVQLVGRRVAERPQVGRGDQDQVERVQRQPAADPADRADQARGQVIAAAPGFRGDQREDPLAVCLAVHQLCRVQVRQPPVQVVQALDHAVVREQPAVLQERMGVLEDVRAGAGVSHVRHERAAPQLVGGRGELSVLPGGDRLLGQRDLAAGGERAHTRPVGVAVTLRGQAVRGVEEPERRRRGFPAGVQPEQAAHGGATGVRPAAAGPWAHCILWPGTAPRRIPDPQE